MDAMVDRWIADEPRLHLSCWDGEGVPLLLCHGMGGNAYWWEKAAPLLSEFCRPAALDFLGHGESDWASDGRYDASLFVQNIEAARRFLGWEKMALAAHSMGARVALEYARRHPERLERLVVIDFLPQFDEKGSRRFERTRRRRQPVYPDDRSMVERFHLEPRGSLLGAEELREVARRCLRRRPEGGFTWKFDWRAFLFRYEPIWPVLPEIRTPTLVVRGENSSILGRPDFERVVRDIPGARGVEIPRAFHHVPLDCPEALAEALSAFLTTPEFARPDRRP